ncbi:hypothetical protein [Rhizobium leguminosarum]|uniref:hypothetical protein n=1 Tax=Rhizobium leguminosarum TaxID=384 RepID=UPI002E0FCFD5|nr:hypothetical protein U8Q02_42430 [Rhizobium leguminosarum]
MKSDTYFAVTYRYYQHNGGYADNGHYTGEKRCATPEEASALAKAINDAARRRKEADERIDARQLAQALKRPVVEPEVEDDEEQEYADRELANDLIPGAGGGYLISAEAQVVRTERKALH